MKNAIIISLGGLLLMLFSFSFSVAVPPKQLPNPIPLQLKGIYKLSEEVKDRFDLSGMVATPKGIYVVADKPWNNYLYRIKPDHSTRTIVIDNFINLGLLKKLNLEAVDYGLGSYYILNKHNSEVYILLPDGVIKLLRFRNKHTLSSGGVYQPTDLTSLAINAADSTLFLARSTGANQILSVKLKYGTIENELNLPQVAEKAPVISDLKYSKGFLYLMDSENAMIYKYDVTSQSVISQFALSHALSTNNEAIIESDDILSSADKLHFADALMLTENEIWVGLDTDGKAPAQVLIFERPEEF